MSTKISKFCLQHYADRGNFGWTTIANVTKRETAYNFYDFLTRIRPSYFESVTGAYRLIAPDGKVECQKIYSGLALEGEKNFDHRRLPINENE